MAESIGKVLGVTAVYIYQGAMISLGGCWMLHAIGVIH